MASHASEEVEKREKDEDTKEGVPTPHQQLIAAQMDARIHQQQPTAPLLSSLPLEIREYVWEYVVLSADPIPARQDRVTEAVRILDDATSLLAVSKPIYDEVSRIFYSKNTFDLSRGSPERAISFLECLTPRNASRIQSAVIRFPFLQDFDATLMAPVPIKLDPPYVNLLASIKARCTSLTTLATSSASTVHAFRWLNRRIDQKDAPIRDLRLSNAQWLRFSAVVVDRAFRFVDDYFRESIPAWARIVTRVQPYDTVSDEDGQWCFEHSGPTILLGMVERYAKTIESVGWELEVLEEFGDEVEEEEEEEEEDNDEEDGQELHPPDDEYWDIYYLYGWL